MNSYSPSELADSLSSRSSLNERSYSNSFLYPSFEIDGPLLHILWCGTANEVILIHTNSGSIYRSRDRGESWKKLHAEMKRMGFEVID